MELKWNVKDELESNKAEAEAKIRIIAKCVTVIIQSIGELIKLVLDIGYAQCSTFTVWEFYHINLPQI